MVNELFASARLAPQGPIVWRTQLPRAQERIYVLVRAGEVVYIGQDPHAGAQRLPNSSARLLLYWTWTSNPSRAEHQMLHWFTTHFNQLPTGNQNNQRRSIIASDTSVRTQVNPLASLHRG